MGEKRNIPFLRSLSLREVKHCNLCTRTDTHVTGEEEMGKKQSSSHKERRIPVRVSNGTRGERTVVPPKRETRGSRGHRSERGENRKRQLVVKE